MKGLTGTVKLPLSLSANSGLAKDAFKNSPQLQEIEFVLNGAADLSDANASFKSQLKKIYEMFAGGSSDFATSPDLTSTNNWLPQTPSPGAPQVQTGEAANPSPVTFAGITWTVAKITNPTTGNGTPADSTGGSSGSSGINSNTTKVEITGKVATTSRTASAVGSFKYKYTTPQGTLSNNSQTLPSNIKTIKITLNKG